MSSKVLPWGAVRVWAARIQRSQNGAGKDAFEAAATSYSCRYRLRRWELGRGGEWQVTCGT